ncbi:hypothetical protein Tco_0464186 [Tanacetum coccineum]
MRCRREISKDLRLAREINALCARLTAIVDERENFADELDILVGRSVPGKMDEFMKQVQAVVGLVGGVAVFQEEEDAVSIFSFPFASCSWFSTDCTTAVGVADDVPVFKMVRFKLNLPLYVCSAMLLAPLSVVLMSKTSSRARSLVFAKWERRKVIECSRGTLCFVGISKRDKITHCSDAAYVSQYLISFEFFSINMDNTQTSLLQELSRAADSYDIKDQLFRRALPVNTGYCILEFSSGLGSGRFANEVGDSVSRAHLQLGVEIINVLKTHVGFYGIVLQVEVSCATVESSMEVVNLRENKVEI